MATRNEEQPKDNTKASEKTAETKPADKDTTENTGAVSAAQQALVTEASQDSLNPAFASPEVREQVKKDWESGAEHTVDAEQALKDAENNNKK